MISRRTLLTGAGAAGGLIVMRSGPSQAAGTRDSWDSLRRNLTGDLVVPGDPGYPAAVQLYLTAYDSVKPGAVAFCESAGDVSTCLKFAQDKAIRFAVRSGGHSTAGYSTLKGGLIVDVSRLNGVSVTSPTQATIGAGAQNIDVLTGLAASGLATVGGACATVGAAGFLSGGGIGFLTRSLGIACDAVTSAQVVLADGTVVTASAGEHPDLYWAIRGGGGGQFGVVTSFTVRPSPVTTVALTNLTFAYDDAAEVLDGYTRWLEQAPRTIGGACAVQLADSAPGGVPVPIVIMVSTGTAEQLAAEADRLVSLTAAPVARTASVVPYSALMLGLYGCATLTTEQCHRAGATPGGQLPRAAFGLDRSRLFDGPVAASTWADALAVFDTERVAGSRHALQVLPLGGAAADLSRTATAYVHRDSLYTATFNASVPGASSTAAQRASAVQWSTNGFSVLDPVSNGETYVNFVDPYLKDWRSSYYAENYARLVKVKKKYDPSGGFRFAQSIG